MTLAYKLDLDCVKLDHHSMSKVISFVTYQLRTRTHTHTADRSHHPDHYNARQKNL